VKTLFEKPSQHRGDACSPAALVNVEIAIRFGDDVPAVGADPFRTADDLVKGLNCLGPIRDADQHV
jgi:hypothetical protein